MDPAERARLLERSRELSARCQAARDASAELLARSHQLVERSLQRLGNRYLGPAPPEPLVVPAREPSEAD